jgi:L-lactate dehydrogenase complex protein LldG
MYGEKGESCRKFPKNRSNNGTKKPIREKEVKMDRNKILQTIRKNKAQAAPLPKTFSTPEEEPKKLLDRFKEILQQVGGECFDVKGAENLNLFVEEHFPGAKDFRKKETWEKYPPGCGKEELSQLETVILEAQFGVAENGAVWMDESNFPNRLVPFIAEKLVVCLDSEQICGNMHTAYSRLENRTNGFGVFVSGPSKTADIEQNLVLGAHGAKEYFVVLF